MVKVGSGSAETVPPQPGLESLPLLSLPEAWSFSPHPPSGHPQWYPHWQGLPGRQMAREPGKWRLSLQYMAEHGEVGKGTEQKGKELGQTVANYGEERSTAAG